MGGVHRIAAPIGAALVAVAVFDGGRARAQSLEELQHMSIAELADIDVSSVSKTPEKLNQAAASIYVITHDDIIRSGATNIPDILRLAPNLEVYQTSASQYVVTARGFSGNSADQNFSNKLLVLIDGRSVYTPLYSGVYWDIQGVMPDDVDRIEVISGPGATLWGANAVNGVINIITRKSDQTQGGLAVAEAGNLTRELELRYGGRLNSALSYRIYGMTFQDQDSVTATGAKANDHWARPQAGFRVDWAPASGDTVTVQGDGYSGVEAQGADSDQIINGANILERWTHPWRDGSTLQVQAYYDHSYRETQNGGGSIALDTYDLDVQQNLTFGPHHLVLGAGARMNRYGIVDSQFGLAFVPTSRTLNLADFYAQDTWDVASSVKAIIGLKLEGDPYLGVTPLPDLRLTWTPTARTFLWAAVSQAVRSPTPFDRDVQETVGPVLFVKGGPDFEPERLTAYEIGGRFQPIERLSLSVSTYYNQYRDLRSIEITPKTVFPLYWGNTMRGDVWGVESWADFQVTPWWQLRAAYTLLRKDLSFAPGASGLTGVAQAGDDPENQASLKSSMNLGRDVTLDADLRYMDALPAPSVPAYVELNGRIGWNVTDKIQLSLTGQNLLRGYHQEYPAPDANAAPRQVYAAVRLRF